MTSLAHDLINTSPLTAGAGDAVHYDSVKCLPAPQFEASENDSHSISSHSGSHPDPVYGIIEGEVDGKVSEGNLVTRPHWQKSQKLPHSILLYCA